MPCESLCLPGVMYPILYVFDCILFLQSEQILLVTHPTYICIFCIHMFGHIAPLFPRYISLMLAIYMCVCNSHLVPMHLPLDSLHTYIYIYIHLFPKYIPIIWSYPCLNSLNTHTPQCRWPNHICFLVETLFRLVKSSFL